jgi:putative peptidoglycan lipid II flippase
MGGLLWLAAPIALVSNVSAHGLLRAFAVLALISAGIATYGLLLRLFGVIRWSEAVNAIRQTEASSLRD